MVRPNVTIEQALETAVEDGSEILVRTLLRNGCDPNTRDAEGRPMLAVAAGKAKTRAMSELLQAGADPNATDLQGRTAMHHAALAGFVSPINVLLGAGADPLAKDHQGRTPFDCIRDTRWNNAHNVMERAEADARDAIAIAEAKRKMAAFFDYLASPDP